MNQYTFITLRQRPQLKEQAATWFHSKWKVPQEAYLGCMESYLNNETENGWYLCLDEDRMVGGLGVIENDFHNKKDLTPNVLQCIRKRNIVVKGLPGNCSISQWMI